MRYSANRAYGSVKVTDLYEGAEGWQAAERGVHLTPELARELQARGYTMVRVRIRWWKRREVSLWHYLVNQTSGNGVPLNVRYARRSQ